MRPRIRIRAYRVRSTGEQSAADNDPLSACDKDTAANWRDPPWLEYTRLVRKLSSFFFSLSLFFFLPRRERRWLIAVRLLSTSMHTGPCDGRMRGPGESRAPTSSPPFPPLSLLSKNGRNSPKCQSIQSYIYIIFPYSDNFPFSRKSGGTFPPSISFLPKSRNTAGGSSPRGSIRCIDVAGTRLAINHQGKGSTLGILAVPSGLARVWYACRFHPWRVIMRLDRETETETELREDRAFRYREQGALFVKKSAGQRPRVTSRGKW